MSGASLFIYNHFIITNNNDDENDENDAKDDIDGGKGGKVGAGWNNIECCMIHPQPPPTLVFTFLTS